MGITNVKDIRKLLRKYVDENLNDLKNKLGVEEGKRIYLSYKQISNAIYTCKGNGKVLTYKEDQDKVEKLLLEWKKQDKNAEFFIRKTRKKCFTKKELFFLVRC